MRVSWRAAGRRRDAWARLERICALAKTHANFRLPATRVRAASSMATSPAIVLLFAAFFGIAAASAEVGAAPALNILAFGAIPDNSTYAAAIVNGEALLAAMNAANAGLNGSRTVVIPNGNFYMLPSNSTPGFVGLTNVELVLDGVVYAWTEDFLKWPTIGGSSLTLFSFTDCTGLRLTGNGVVEGQGYWWWWYVIVVGIDNRPNLMDLQNCEDFYFNGWTLRNAPEYHVFLGNVFNAFLYNITIHVDVEDQAALLNSLGLMTDGSDGLPIGIPTFPLNTDGIDVSGVNITVQHCRILNYDDSVCLKPNNQNDAPRTCTEDVLFEDIDITLGVGASTGSVPPNTAVNCIRNCTFRDIRFHAPIKAIYIKPNPGNDGTGIVDHITYENIVAHDTLWWSIWVSTQQQHQPGGGANTHCSFFYPLWNTTCATQPLVPVTNLVVRNVTMTGALFSPGILRCNDSGPCTGWLFEDVSISSATDYPTNQFICAGIGNSTWTGTVSPPVQACFNTVGVPEPPLHMDLPAPQRPWLVRERDGRGT